MENINVQKIIARKSKEQTGLKFEEVRDLFVEYVFSQLNELKKIFPTIIIPHGDGGFDGRIVGVSYSSAMWTDGKARMGCTTHNIDICSYIDRINVGYGANSASGFEIPYSKDMNKTQLRMVFKQALEKLITGAYYEYADFHKQDNPEVKVWYKGEMI